MIFSILRLEAAKRKTAKPINPINERGNPATYNIAAVLGRA
jgi:hypothetical protein